MGVILSIRKLDITTDELGRTVSTLTSLYHESVLSEVENLISEVVMRDENDGGEVPYADYENDEYEIYGDTLESIMKECEEKNLKIVLNGETANAEQLYEVKVIY